MYDTIDDTFTMPLSRQDKCSPSYPGKKPLIATRSCTDFNYLDEDIKKNIVYISTSGTDTTSKFETNSAYVTFSPVFVGHANTHM